MNYERIYRYRFQGVDQEERQKVWNEISAYLYDRMGRPQKVLDPAAGRGEFLLAVPAQEKWGVDGVKQLSEEGITQLKFIEADIFEAELPSSYFDGIFISNFLEHLSSQRQVAEFLAKMHLALKTGGKILIMGPNFKACMAEYFDCSDHILALTHVSVAEHLYGVGFDLESVHPRFLPYSFRGLLPPSPTLTRLYLKMPIFWPILGKQFLVMGSKPTNLTG